MSGVDYSETMTREGAGSALFLLGLIVATVGLGVTLFDMSVAGALALYFVIWWTALFAFLPFGVRSQTEAGEIVAGSDPGAPSRPAMRRKALLTTVATSVVFIGLRVYLPWLGL